MLRLLKTIMAPRVMSRILEIMYILNWMWLFFVTLFRFDQATGTFIELIKNIATREAFLVYCFLFIIMSICGQLKNILILRRISLFINAVVLIWFCIRIAEYSPLSAGAGFIYILTLLTIVSFIRLNITE